MKYIALLAAPAIAAPALHHRQDDGGNGVLKGRDVPPEWASYASLYSTYWTYTTSSESSTTDEIITPTIGTATSTSFSETSPPVETTSTPDETTSTPDETTSTPDATTSTPDATTSTPDETTSTPDATTSTPDETTSTPWETTSTPLETITPTPFTPTTYTPPESSTPSPTESTTTSSETPSTTSSTPSATPTNAWGWEYYGCYADSVQDRVLDADFYYDNEHMTVESCQWYCGKKGYHLSGVEYGQECYCDNELNPTYAPDPAECSFACTGNSLEKCGGSNRISIYYKPAGYPSVAPAPEGWASVGCFQDNQVNRALKDIYYYNYPDGLTVEACAGTCAGYGFFGVEWGQECFCGNVLYSYPAESGCDVACKGNQSELCGGSNRLNVYENLYNHATSTAPSESATPSETPSETATPSETPSESATPSETLSESATPSETGPAGSETPTWTAPYESATPVGAGAPLF